MMDFVFTPEPGRTEALRAALRALRRETDPGEDRLWSGDWGTLVTVGSANPGFLPVETGQAIWVVLGGPLPRSDSAVASGDRADDGTRWLMENAALDNTAPDRASPENTTPDSPLQSEIDWRRDLVGHFLLLLLDKPTGQATVITDMNGFIPAYLARGAPRDRGEGPAVPGSASGARPYLLGSHADALSRAAGVDQDLDAVSVVDFLNRGTVTPPYTMYEDVRVLPAASRIALTRGEEPRVETYWEPWESEPDFTFEQAAADLRETLEENVRRMCAGQERVSLLLSGGEDSRVVATLVPPPTEVDAVTFVDTYNRETRMAQRVARRLGLHWRWIRRSPTHYLEHADKSLRLMESHNFLIHAHLSGLENSLPAGRRCLTGLYSDSLFKGSVMVMETRLGIATGVRRDRLKFIYGPNEPLPGDALGLAVEERRASRLAEMRERRPQTWAEFAQVTPASAWPGMAQVSLNRRLCFSNEPFMDGRVVELAAAVPQSWKLNGRLFHAAMKPVLRKTWDIPHAKHNLPYFGLWVNAPVLATRAIGREARRLGGISSSRRGLRNNRAWPDWQRLVDGSAFEDKVAGAWTGALPALAERTDLRRHLERLAGSGEMPAWQRLAHLQVLLWLGQIADANRTSTDANGTGRR